MRDPYDVPAQVWTARKRDGTLLPEEDRFTLVYLYTLNKAVAGDGFVFPGDAHLGEVLGCSPRTIRDRTGRLKDAGWIRRGRRDVAGRKMLGWELAGSEPFDLAAARHMAVARQDCGGTPPERWREHPENVAAARQTEWRQPAANVAAARQQSGGSPPHGGSPPQRLTTVNNTTTGESHLGDQRPRSERERVEDEVAQALIEAKVLLDPPLTYMAPIVERVQAGDATILDVSAILLEWKRRRTSGDNVQPSSAAALFHGGKRWFRTQVEYLRRQLAPRHARPKAGNPALPGLREHWAQVHAEAARVAQPEAPYTDEDRAHDDALYDQAMGLPAAAGGSR